ncbi:unnamed protein product [Symbiodinium pilosum]|uniref:Choloylglycine hydrolase/NAAA C-terminal domain-containing protein n=1 Tax=Symbiodinium pilosum TaxID=2952 RepID=A0A812Y6Y7_SYMPI|nr:unnamed protein product [Symbiodinium pilosum]
MRQSLFHPCIPLRCSYVEIPWEDAQRPSYLIPRTMELGNVFGSTNYSIEVVPRGGGNKFGYLAPMNIFHLPPTGRATKIPFEGMNEAGLTVSALYFAESVYEQSHPAKKDLTVLDVIPALLANCSTADAARELLESVSVVRAMGNIPEDTGVMTNAAWLCKIVHLSPSYPLENNMLQVKVDDDIGVVPRPVGHGWNLFGLPGDSSSPSRFVRLFYLRGYGMKANPPKSFDDAVVLGTALLNNVFIPFGSVAADPREPGDAPEYTPYGILKSPQERVMLIRGYRNSQWRKLDLNRLDFSQVRSWPLEDGSLGVQETWLKCCCSLLSAHDAASMLCLLRLVQKLRSWSFYLLTSMVYLLRQALASWLTEATLPLRLSSSVLLHLRT